MFIILIMWLQYLNMQDRHFAIHILSVVRQLRFYGD
jgi:hypothetical protein